MSWVEKKFNWKELAAVIRCELELNAKYFPSDRIADIRHYLDHGEFGIAFEYLILEIIESQNATLKMSVTEVTKLALFFDLNDQSECLVGDGGVWERLTEYIKDDC